MTSITAGCSTVFVSSGVETNQPNPGQDAEKHRKPRILIADDTPSSRELLLSILDGCGYEVAEVADGSEILKCAIAFKPHVVILDFQMSRLDGCAAAILLRKQPVLEKIPVIALIAAVSEISADQITAAGFTAHLVKPIRPERLRHCVARLL